MICEDSEVQASTPHGPAPRNRKGAAEINQPMPHSLSRVQNAIVYYLHGKALRPARLRKLLGGVKGRLNWPDGIAPLIQCGMVKKCQQRGYYLPSDPPT